MKKTSNKTWSSNKIDSEINKMSELPIGAIISSGADLTNKGFLICDGSAVSRTNYPELFSAIGTVFGAGDGSTTFNIPDLRNKFVEGTKDSLGTIMSAGLPNITGTATYINSDGISSQYPDSGALYFQTYNYSQRNTLNTQGTGKRDLMIDASRSNSIYGKSNTVQPPAVKLYYFIKATKFGEVKKEVLDDTKTTVANVWSASKVQTLLSEKIAKAIISGKKGYVMLTDSIALIWINQSVTVTISANGTAKATISLPLSISNLYCGVSTNGNYDRIYTKDPYMKDSTNCYVTVVNPTSTAVSSQSITINAFMICAI